MDDYDQEWRPTQKFVTKLLKGKVQNIKPAKLTLYQECNLELTFENKKTVIKAIDKKGDAVFFVEAPTINSGDTITLQGIQILVVVNME